jgi:hypothetical protein
MREPVLIYKVPPTLSFIIKRSEKYKNPLFLDPSVTSCPQKRRNHEVNFFFKKKKKDLWL